MKKNYKNMNIFKEYWINYIEYNNIVAIKYLLDNNLINVNIKDEYKNSILILATFCNNIEIVKLLLTYKGINVNIQNYWNNTALILASCNNYIEIVKLLLNHLDINIFLKDNNNKTALYWAKNRNNKEIETLLITHDKKKSDNMKKYYIKSNLPFGLKKNDIVEYVNNNTCKRISDDKTFNYNVEDKEFFSEIIYPKLFNKNENVYLEIPISANRKNCSKKSSYLLPAYTSFKFVSNTDNEIIVKFNNNEYGIKLRKDLKIKSYDDENNCYYFINSEGKILKEIKNKTKEKDNNRINIRNYFNNKSDAEIKLKKFMEL
jgi:hypothetical protein